MSGLMVRTPHKTYLLVDVSTGTGWYYSGLGDLAVEGFIAPLKEFGWEGLDSDDGYNIKEGKPLFREELMRWEW